MNKFFSYYRKEKELFMDISRMLSNRIFSLNRLFENDKIIIRLLLLDFFSAMYAGYKQNKAFADGVTSVMLEQGGKEEATVFMQKKKYPARTAAFLNALYGHGAELDDGNKKAMGHIGVHVIPAVLSLAEAERKKQKDIMLAIAAGYEVFARVSTAAQPGMVERSFHSTGMAGALASAVACAKLLGLNSKGIESAMSFACTMSSGLLTYSESQQMIKPINPAKAAETGVFAARMAQMGLIGPENCLEGPNGWFNAVTSKYDEKALFANYDHLLLHDTYFKLYPSCRHTHCVIEAGINLHHSIDYENIKKIEVFIYPNAIKLAGIKFPKDADETKFSVYYTLACSLLFGEYNVNYMNPPLKSEIIINTINKICLIPDVSLEDSVHGVRGAKVRVYTCDDRNIEETVLVPKGDPEKPLTEKDLVLKYNECADNLISVEKRERILRYLLTFGDEDYYSAEELF